MALNAKVGSFTKSTGGAPASQAITGVGFQPEALILWSVSGVASGTWKASYVQSFGFSSSATDVGSSAAVAVDNVATTNTSRRFAAKAFTQVAGSEAARAECDLTSFDADGFTLNWTTNNATDDIIHYIVLGGADLTNSKVIRWQAPAAAGNKAVTGVGFQPDCLIHVAWESATDPPASAANARLMFGVMESGGGEWSMDLFSADNTAVAAHTPGKTWDSDSGIHASTSTIADLMIGDFVSMDADGFTVNFSTTQNGSEFFTLCLKGGQYKAATFTKSTGGAPASQGVTGAGFTPVGVLFGSADVTAAGASAGTLMSVGATDGTTSGASVITEEDTAVTNTNVDALSRTDRVFLKETGFDAATEAEAATTSLDSDGFTLSWNPNDAVATIIGYLAFGSSGAGSQTVSPALIDQSGVVFSPQINLRLALGLIDQSGTTFSPQVNQSVSIGLIDQSAVTFTPQLNLSISLGLIDQSGTVFAFSQITQTVTIGLIDQSSQVFSPSITLSISVGLIDNTATVFTLTQITQTVVIPLISNLATTFDPAITQPGAALTVSPALIDNTGAPFTPTRIRKSGVSRLCAVPTPSTRLNPVTVPASRDCDVN